MGKLMIGNNIVSPVIVNGSPTPSGKYKLYDRVKDDSNNEIGTVSGFYSDVNGFEYAVVCLDAQYRLSTGQYCSNASGNTYYMAYYDDQRVFWNNDCGTGTYNTQMILNYCSTNNYSSSACSHCRSKSFTIDGVTYYGQLPNIKELVDIVSGLSKLDSLDTSRTSYSSLALGYDITKSKWSSTQFDSDEAWCIGNLGLLSRNTKTGNYFVTPILEIPNKIKDGYVYLQFDSDGGVPVVSDYMIDDVSYDIPYYGPSSISEVLPNKTYSLKIGTYQNNVNINSTQVSSNSDTCSFIINGSNITFTGTSTYTTTIDTVIRLGTSLTCCIPYYTPVNYYNGSIKLAEEVRIGDKLLGYNESTQEFQEVEVLNIIHKLRNQIVKVITENHEIEITPDHPILTDKGWAVYDLNIGNYKEVDKIQLDTTLKVLTINGYENILSIECNTLNNAIDTYTFNTTDGVDTYVANDVVNHNATPEKCGVGPSKE